MKDDTKLFLFGGFSMLVILVWAMFGVVHAEDRLAQGPEWNAFATAQVEPVSPVEGKNRDKKRHDDEFQPTPAPAPEPKPNPSIPDANGEYVDPDFGPMVVEPINKRVKPHPQPKPEHHDKATKPERDSHDTRIIDRVVYRASWLPSAYDLINSAWLLVLTLVVVVTARRAGLDLWSLLMFWK